MVFFFFFLFNIAMLELEPRCEVYCYTCGESRAGDVLEVAQWQAYEHARHVVRLVNHYSEIVSVGGDSSLSLSP